MTKSQLFTAAHKLAKAWRLKMEGGDYSIYFSLALTQINKVSKVYSYETTVKEINIAIRKISSDLDLITRKVTKKYTHGIKEFDATYKLEAAKKDLKDGQFFGKTFTKNGMICAWVRSVKTVTEAY